jgi:hypothetical protein
MKSLLSKIAGRLSGMNEEDLTTAEGQIVKLLVKAGYLERVDQGDYIDYDCAGFDGDPEPVIESQFVQKVTVVDPDTRLDVEVEIRKMATGPMIGLDGSFLDQLGPKECPSRRGMDNPRSPYDNSIINVPDDE